jgi:hypothetical protein
MFQFPLPTHFLYFRADLRYFKNVKPAHAHIFPRYPVLQTVTQFANGAQIGTAQRLTASRWVK